MAKAKMPRASWKIVKSVETSTIMVSNTPPEEKTPVGDGEKILHEDPLQVAKELEKHKQLGYEAEVEKITKDGKRIRQRITKTPAESHVSKILPAIQIPDVVKAILKVL